MAYPVADSYNCASGGVIAGGRSNGVAGTGITLNDTAHPRIYQRVGTSKEITISGNYSGSPTRIQARHCPVGTATNMLESTYLWSDLVINPAGGTFSANYNVPQGDDWIIQVRDGVNRALAASGTYAFGVGIFIAMLGQSNMENSFSSIVGWPLGAKGALVKQSTNPIYRLGNINDAFPPSSLSPVYGTGVSGSGVARTHGNPIVIMANDLVAAYGCPVLLLTYAASGTSSALWQPGGTYLTNFFNGLDVVGGDFEAAIWYQGENDSASSVSAETYQANLQNIFNACKSHTGRSSADFNFGVVGVGPGLTTSGAWGGAWSAEGTMAPIRKAQQDFIAANTSNGAFSAGSAIDGNLGDASSIHINTLGRQGYRYTEALKRRFSGATYGIEGPAISGASRAGSVITVNITQRGGTALVGTGQQAFRVFDDGVTVTIDSSAVVGNTITLTLAATPVGTVTMDYAMANAPFGSTTTPSEVCYDNQTIPGDTLGLPLQPKYLFTVS